MERFQGGGYSLIFNSIDNKKYLTLASSTSGWQRNFFKKKGEERKKDSYPAYETDVGIKSL